MKSTRREFLEGTLTAGLAAASASTGWGYPQNSAVRVGIIGAGGRATRLMQSLLKMEGVKVTALCDVYDAHLERARKILADAGQGGAFTTRLHEELLKRSDVDAVLIGSPDHWHVPHTVAACEAGKDVFVEKPLTHSVEEGRAVIEAQDKSRRVVQVGTQQRSMPHFKKAREIIQSGRLGEIHKVHMTWNRNFTPFRKQAFDIKESEVDWKRFLGNAPARPFDPFRMRQWRWFWDFGNGILGDLMVHWLDSINYLMDLPRPASAATVGDQFATAGAWETPDTIQTILHYPERKLQVHFEGTFVNQYTKAHIVIMGTAASMHLDRGRCEIMPEPRSKVEAQKFGDGVDERGADFDRGVDGDGLHLADWLAAIRERRKPVCPAEAGVLAADGAHLGNRALREGGTAKWKR